MTQAPRAPCNFFLLLLVVVVVIVVIDATVTVL